MNTRARSPFSTRWGLGATMACAVALAAAPLGAPATPLDTGRPASAQSPAAHGNSAVSSGFSASRWGDPSTDAVSKDAYGNHDARKDPGSLFTVTQAIGARSIWKQLDSDGLPVTGRGIGVALLDSGVAQVPGLDAAGKVAYGPDLSIEGNGVLIHQDTFGHGTFMAGIIAGRGATNPSSDLSRAPAKVQLGVAPDAGLLAMKLATTDGSVDVSQVIAALDWVTQHPVLPDGTRVRVINLSYGTDSSQDYLADPLAAAAENAWRHGIVVVTSAGNGGSDNGRLTDPAINPHVIAVGATDSNTKVSGWAANKTNVAEFSQVGSEARHTDLVAPGTSLVSARAPGSFIDVNNPSGLVSGDVSGKLFRGSGTSESAAVVSGSVALLLQAYPTLTPDQVKYALTSSADPIKKADPIAVGAGTLDLTEALKVAGKLAGADKKAATLRAAAIQKFPTSTGQGSIDAARAGDYLVDADGVELSGEIDVQGTAWNPAAWWQATSTLSAWSGGQWLGVTWTGDDWLPATDGLSSHRWSSHRWSSHRWSSADWDSASWTSHRWSSHRWSSHRWSGDDWDDSGMSSHRWSGAGWT